MAQLIKLKDYISRYEWNAFRYPGQYIRLKQEKWHKLYNLWLTEREMIDRDDQSQLVDSNNNLFSKMKSFFKKEAIEEENMQVDLQLPETEQQLRQYFLDQLYPFQLKWATSTISEVSFMDESFNNDATLIYFLQRFPDIYLMMYQPVFNIQNAPIDGEIIMISPLNIEVIYLLEDHPETVFMASDERTWTVEQTYEQRQILSPVIALRRTEKIVKSILNKKGVSLSISKTILSRSNDIIFSSEPYQTTIIGKRQYDDWFAEKRRLSSPLKNSQLRAADALLKYCLTTSVRRPEWEDDDVIDEEL